MLTANDRGDPSRELSLALSPELRVKRVLYKELGVCEQQPPTPVTPPMNFSPILRNPVDHVNATVGELLVYKVKDVNIPVLNNNSILSILYSLFRTLSMILKMWIRKH